MAFYKNSPQNTTHAQVSFTCHSVFLFHEKQHPLIPLIWNAALPFLLCEGIFSAQSINRRKCNDCTQTQSPPYEKIMSASFRYSLWSKIEIFFFFDGDDTLMCERAYSPDGGCMQSESHRAKASGWHKTCVSNTIDMLPAPKYCHEMHTETFGLLFRQR